MRKILKLIKSEWIKLFSKVSTYIIMLVVAGAAIALVCINYKLYNSVDDYGYYEDYLQTNIDDLKSELTYYEGATDKESVLNVKLINENLAILEEYKTVKDKEEWRQAIFSDYLQSKYNVFIAQLIKEGYSYEDIQNSYYTNIYYIGIIADDALMNADVESIDSYITKKQAESVTVKEKYNRNSYVEHAEEEIKEYNNLLAQNKKTFTELEKRLNELNKQKLDKEKELEIASIKNQMKNIEIENECYNTCIYAYQYVVDNKIDDTTKSWEDDVVNNLIDSAGELAYAKKYSMTEEEFKNSDESSWYDYDTYVYQNIGYPAERIAEYRYSLEEHIKFDTTAIDYISEWVYSMLIVGIAGIFVAGSMVSHEYSTGTIRFLLTRPVKRWKVLFSKVFVLIAFLCVLAVIWIATNFITAGILGDFSDFTIPVVQATFNGETVDVEVQSFIVESLKGAAYSLVYVAFFVILTFVLSTILKSTVFSMGLGMGSLFACAMVVLELPYSEAFTKNPLKFEWLKYTPLPYSSPSAYYDLLGIDPYSIWPKIGANINLGLIVMLTWSVILLVLAFIVFCRLDVKNQ